MQKMEKLISALEREMAHMLGHRAWSVTHRVRAIRALILRENWRTAEWAFELGRQSAGADAGTIGQYLELKRKLENMEKKVD